MNYFRYLLCIFAFLGFVACENENYDNEPGENVTEEFLKNQVGEYVEQNFGETISISKDAEIQLKKVRQVGRVSSPTVPYPTSCTYLMTGKILAVYELFDTYRARINPDTGEGYLAPETHMLDFVVHRVQWIGSDDELSSEDNRSNCKNFEDEMNASAPQMYSYGFEILGPDQLRFHTSGGGDYVGQKERTESTLDEIFVRQ